MSKMVSMESLVFSSSSKREGVAAAPTDEAVDAPRWLGSRDAEDEARDGRIFNFDDDRLDGEN